MWSQTCGKMALIVLKVTLKKIVFKIRTFMGYILAVTHFATHFTHVSRHFAILSRKQKKCLEKTVLKMWSPKSSRKTSFVPRIRQRLQMFSSF